MTTGFRAVLRVAVLASLVTALAAPAVDARPGGGRGGMGSRGANTNSAPPSTATAPTGAQPMQRTEMPATAARPGGVGAGAATAAAPSRGLGFGGGLMAGLLGAGLLGMMFGGGLFGGLGGLASMLGLLLQVALIGGLIWLAVRFFRRRSEPTLAGAGANGPMARSALGGALGGGLAGGSAGSALGGFGGQVPVLQPVEIVKEDYAAFERLLGEVQTAYGRQDVERLTHLMTPEMVRYMSADLEEDRSKGLVNEVSDPKLLQGDLAEAWREGSTEYATVAMRFSVVDAVVDKASGRVVSGDRARPSEATELWTFRRDSRGEWLLSAIQQTA